jgi:hypothetical protein
MVTRRINTKEVDCLADAHGKDWSAYHADCVEFAKHMPSNSIDFSIYSPPFASIFVYSNSENDMGNCADDAEFKEHYQFLVNEMFRVHKPGTLSAVHCSDLPSTKWRDGEIGLKDFMGDIVSAHLAAGFILHSRVTIWRDPVVEMTRTKALGLLYKQVIKDSSRSRVGMPDYLCVFRKPGERDKPVWHSGVSYEKVIADYTGVITYESRNMMPDGRAPITTDFGFSVDQWQQLASPVWMNINQTRTINSEKGMALPRSEVEERHLCPLQLDVIENALFLWSNKDEVVFSPFMGVGSEGAMSIRHKRKFIGTELKESYWSQACRHLQKEAEKPKGFFD